MFFDEDVFDEEEEGLDLDLDFLEEEVKEGSISPSAIFCLYTFISASYRSLSALASWSHF